ncbi:MAG: folylpolyglutamate synthase/dihydrofolate synthase family protein [Clostridiaceae bacterium]|nr:folylpolyglutamate synthase/dihydrofolate synthase family protein [Clostridiaceae bacterium]
MNYEQSVNYIHSFLKFGVKLGLDRMRALLDALGNPEKNMKYIHVAGTNGKGTTSTMLSNILIDAGYKTGLFTSPYVFDFCERIRVNGENIPHDDLADIINRIKPVVEKLNSEGVEITEFELITAAGLLYFSEQGCDYAVMEVGLGGRFDATNVIPAPVAAVITSISYDHMAVLGNTIEQIAAEKCGIIKEGSRVVTTSLQNREALQVIRDTVKRKNADLGVARYSDVEILEESISGTDIEYLGNTYHIPLVGRHQIENTIGVIEAAYVIDKVCEKNIQNGIKNTVIRGRMELVDDNTLIDGGHNEECAQALKNVIEKFLASRKITAIIGMMADKECEKYLADILPLCDGVVFTKPHNPRSEEPENLTEIAKKYIKNISIENEPKMAYYKTKEQADFTLVCGSFYMLSDIFN